MLVLYQGGSERGQSALLQVREHVEQVDRGDELDDCITQELETLVVLNIGFGLAVTTEPRHDVDQHVDAALAAARKVHLEEGEKALANISSDWV